MDLPNTNNLQLQFLLIEDILLPIYLKYILFYIGRGGEKGGVAVSPFIIDTIYFINFNKDYTLIDIIFFSFLNT